MIPPGQSGSVPVRVEPIRLARLRGLPQALHLSRELETQLLGFVVRKPFRHVRERGLPHAVFRRLGQIEEALGVTLFERCHRTGYTPTAKGEEMVCPEQSILLQVVE
jgi:regulatory helix-turn-helix LysR family protein